MNLRKILSECVISQMIGLTVLATMPIYCNYRQAEPVTKKVICSDPYAIKPLRKMIDAFKIYGHWVKEGQTQNRAPQFENTTKFILLPTAGEESDTSFRTWLNCKKTTLE